jgi:integrase
MYWIKYYKDGAPQYESSESCKYSDAQNLLEQRRAEIFNGTHLDSKARRITVGDLLDSVERHYKINGQDHEWAERVLRKHLRPVFGLRRAAKVKYETVERYIEQRQAEGAANATINRELALLHRAFTLGKEAGRVTIVATLPKKLKENNVRKGFFERDQFVALRSALPSDIKPVVTFAYWTGCRKGEILSLLWPQVDWAERVVRLEPGETKNDDARVIPLVDELYEMLKLQKAMRDERWPACAWVFSRRGNRIKDFRKAWEQACKAAGVTDSGGDPARVFHDLRRTGVRNLIRAGVPERVAMSISGHKTRSVFDRYNIVSEKDLHEAGRRLNTYISNLDSQTSGDITVTAAVTKQGQCDSGSTCKLLN